MSWVAAAIAGSSLISGYMGSRAAKDAARTQAEAANRAMQMEREMFDISRADLGPFREAGYRALRDIEALRPYLQQRFNQPYAKPQQFQPPAERSINEELAGRAQIGFGGPVKPFPDAGPLGRAILESGIASPVSAEPSAGTTVTDPQTGRSFVVGQPTDQSLDTTQAYNRAMSAFAPSAQPTTIQELAGGEMYSPLQEYLDPSMAFRMQYGTQATERLANVGGGALSGNTLRALQEFGQGLASTEYGNAFNRFQGERSNIYNLLSNIAGMGQGSVNTGVQASQNLASNLTGLTTGAGAAQAAGTVGAANAWSQALQGPANYLQLSALLGRNPLGPVAQAGGIPGAAPTSSFAPQAAMTSYA